MSTSTPSTASGSSDSPLAHHLNTLFAPLDFNQELSQRILTHMSHKEAVQGHNARFSFMGRRVLHSYLLLFLHSSTASPPSLDYEDVASRALNTYILGEFVAPQWALGDVIRWTPARPVEDKGLTSLKGIGLYKVHGTVVEAVMGGVFHQFGGSVAHRLFHTRLLPHILLPGRSEGLHDSFHEDALATCEKMGGANGPLVLS
ncbi:hypothetical protein HETIRDRAFT_454355 [Heterobasidion irregulare TC 32-1]|uniref:RNase III domain-containing protein n=1 Tax=Heterobasidion irregulare (strain TC 32-1) TaxID=747525 RepID=W4JXZ6_HETIT|nr:uncharacterized protein HETIRDRAFT_454355 [Heterobasidion irregulare TC 32-1]ETW78408.1 hypothetical protein HETIRDRAFT_454355 [Heterobasidion irregulare TC 32-1]